MPSQLRDERDTIREEDIQGLKYFRKLWPLFERLRDVGCGRDKAGNRQLFMDIRGDSRGDILPLLGTALAKTGSIHAPINLLRW